MTGNSGAEHSPGILFVAEELCDHVSRRPTICRSTSKAVRSALDSIDQTMKLSTMSTDLWILRRSLS